MLLTTTEQTQTQLAMGFCGLVAITGIALLIAATLQNAL